VSPESAARLAAQQADEAADRTRLTRWRMKCREHPSKGIKHAENHTRHLNTVAGVITHLRRLVADRRRVYAVSGSDHAHVTNEIDRALFWLESGETT
jgi:hypothetical protein